MTHTVLDGIPIPDRWKDRLDERQTTQVRFADLYKTEFHHGATGHNDLLLIAILVELLFEADETIRGYETPASPPGSNP